MPTTFVLIAHPEPASFNGAWSRATMEAARTSGDTVLISDLCAMGFDPVERPGHYGTTGPFDPLKAQEAAARAGLPPDVADEVGVVVGRVETHDRGHGPRGRAARLPHRPAAGRDDGPGRTDHRDV